MTFIISSISSDLSLFKSPQFLYSNSLFDSKSNCSFKFFKKHGYNDILILELESKLDWLKDDQKSKERNIKLSRKKRERVP